MTEQLQASVRNLGIAVDELLGVSDLLREDLRLIIEGLIADSANQMLRRAFVRGCWAYVEAIAFGIKRFTYASCQLGEVDLSSEVHEFLSEQRLLVDPDGYVQVKRVPAESLENVKRTFKLSSEIFGLDWEPDFGGVGWRRLRESLEIRHRLTHPKRMADVIVSDEDFQAQKDGIAWFVQLFNAFQETAHRKYAENKA